MSTPATFSPITLAALTAVARSMLVSLMPLGAAATVEVRPELAGTALPLHGGDHPAADHERPDVGTLGLLDELLDQDVGIELAEGGDHRLGRLLGLGQHHPQSLGALEQLHHHRGPADESSSPAMSWVEWA
jgi:hypothetical protein